MTGEEMMAKDAAFFRCLGTYLYCLQWKMPDPIYRPGVVSTKRIDKVVVHEQNN